MWYRLPSPLQQTTVLTGVKGSLASLGGFAALDTGSAPWSEQLWAMGGRVGSGLRVVLNRVLGSHQPYRAPQMPLLP